MTHTAGVVWSPRRVVLSALTAAPSTILALAPLLFFALIVFEPSARVTAALAMVAVAIVLARVVWLIGVVGRRTLRIDADGIAVLQGERILDAVQWKDLRSVEFTPADGPWMAWAAFFSSVQGLSYFAITEHGRWGRIAALPDLLAVFDSDQRALFDTMARACHDRGIECRY